MKIDIKNLRKYLLQVDIESFIKSMQYAINECPQGIHDNSAYWASMRKNIYTPYNDSEEAIEDCIKHRVSLFTLEDSKVLRAHNLDYFHLYLSSKSKEIYHYAKIYEHLIKIKEMNISKDKKD